MQEPKKFIAPGCRILLVCIVCAAGYVALQPSYNLAHWTPSQQMRSIGFSYDTILAYEQHLHKFMHFSLAILITLLLNCCRFYFSEMPRARIGCGMVIVTVMILLLEAVQSFFGRGAELVDIILGLSGTILASVLLYGFTFRNGRIKPMKNGAKP